MQLVESERLMTQKDKAIIGEQMAKLIQRLAKKTKNHEMDVASIMFQTLGGLFFKHDKKWTKIMIREMKGGQ